MDATQVANDRVSNDYRTLSLLLNTLRAMYIVWTLSHSLVVTCWIETASSVNESGSSDAA